MDWLRSILAVTLGYAVMVAGVMLYFHSGHGTTSEEGGALPTPTGNEQLMILAVGFAAAVAGGLVCTLLAPRNRYKHLRVLAGLVLLMAVVNAILVGEAQPLTFQVATAVLALVGVFVGGSLKRGQRL